MVGAILKFKRGMDKTLEWMAIASMGILTLDVLWGVATRYFLGQQAQWTEELATTLMIWVALLGAALAYGEKSHLGVDIITVNLHPDAQKIVDYLVQGLVILFAATVMIYGGGELVRATLQYDQVTPALGIKRGYIYLAVPISGLFFVIYSVEAIILRMYGLRNEREQKQDVI